MPAFSGPASRHCRFCPTPLRFAVDEKGKLQVLDLRAPVYELRPDGTCRRVPVDAGVGYFVSHWSTCSHRDEAKVMHAARAAAPGGSHGD